jgi:LAGLIDADG endonuclease
LEHFIRLFSVGSVTPYSQKEKWEYRVNGVKNCSYILPYFEKHLLYSKKKESFLLWKNLRLSLISGEHMITESRVEMIKMAKRVNNV